MAVLVGPQGPTGPQGRQGPVGPRGFDGKRGPAGKNGRDGGQGPKGDRGDRGFPGTEGRQGIQGLRGADGAPGKDGSIAGIEHALDPTDVATNSTPGSGLTAAARDHTHKGVRSIRQDSEPQLFGDVVLATGPGISMAQVGNTITLSSTGTGSPLTFTAGLINTLGTVRNTFFTGAGSSQTLYGGSAASGNLVLSSTSHATKGKIFIGSMGVFDETAAKGAFGQLTTDAGFHFVTADDTNPPYIFTWDERHTVFGLAGDQGAGVGFSYSVGTNTENISFAEPNVAWVKARFNAATFDFYSGGLYLGLSQDASANVSIGTLGLGGVVTAAPTSGQLGLATITAGGLLYGGASNDLAQDASNLFYDGAGHLGIGTNTPSYALDINQNTAGVAGFRIVNANAGASAQIQNNLTNDIGSLAYYGIASSNFSGYAPLDGGKAFFGGYQNDVSIFTQTANDIIFYLNSIEAGRWKSGGGLQISNLSPGGLVLADTSGVLGLTTIGTGLDLTAGVLSSTVIGGITELTGDAVAGPGSGSQSLTLATVNTDVGSFTNANITVNAKGLITAASSGSGGGSDHMLSIDGTDTTYDFLAAKLTATVPATLTVVGSSWPVTPPSSGLKVWLKADAGVTIATGVSNWADQSGNGNDFSQPTGGNQPTLAPAAINGLPAVDFSGSSQYLSNSGFTITGAKHIIFVRKLGVIPALTSFYAPYNLTNGSGVAAVQYFAASANYQNITFISDLSGTGNSTGTNATPDMSWHVDDLSYDGSTFTSPGSYVYEIDGTSQTLANDIGIYAPQGTSVSAIGSDVATGNNFGSYFQGEIAEFLVYDHVLSPTDLGLVKGYLEGRYGISISGATGGAGGAETLDVEVLYDNSTIVLDGSNQLSVGTVPYLSLSGAPTLYYQTVERSGTPVTQEAALDFDGSFFGVSSAGGKTSITFTGSASDHMLSIDGTDTTYDFLAAKLTATVPAALTVVSSGGWPGTPPSSGLTAWLKADAGTTIATGVSNWADQSGNSNDFVQATGANQPTLVSSVINGLPVLRFNGSTQYLTSTALKMSGAKHILLVRKLAATPGSGAFYTPFQIAVPSGAHFGTIFYYCNSGLYSPTTFAHDVTGTVNPSVGAAGALDTSWHVDDNSYDGVANNATSSYGLSRDGTALSLGTDGHESDWTVTESSIGVDLFTGNAVAGDYFYGDIAEILIYDHVLSPTDLGLAKGYLEGRYGIVLAGATGGAGGETLDVEVLYDNSTIVLDGSNQLSVGTVPYASISGTPSSLPPSGAAGGDLTGTYPNPTIGAHKVQFAQMQQIGAQHLVANPTGSTANMTEIPLGNGLDFHNYGTGLTLRNSSPLSDLSVIAPLSFSGTTIGWTGMSAGAVMFTDPIGIPTTDSSFAFNSTTKALTAGKAVTINGATLATNLSLIAGNVTNTDRDRVKLLVGGGTAGATGTSDDSLFDVVPSNVVVRPSVSGGIYAINRFRTNALSSVGATTIDEAATVYIDGKPFIGASVSAPAGASYALHVAGGNVRFDQLVGPGVVVASANGTLSTATHIYGTLTLGGYTANCTTSGLYVGSGHEDVSSTPIEYPVGDLTSAGATKFSAHVVVSNFLITGSLQVAITSGGSILAHTLSVTGNGEYTIASTALSGATRLGVYLNPTAVASPNAIDVRVVITLTD